ncbi:MAG TPA: hypothetical protein VEZ11_04540 [Thermoanaerobaculia bacterium]|nr:hypothetical protein [Thermoanaerobaculia bacterium]
MKPAKRKLLGRNFGLATRQYVYETEGGLEIDQLDFYEVVRRRVLFEDVQLVTYHQEVRWPAVTVAGLIGLFGLIIGIIIFLSDDKTTGGTVLIITAPFVIWPLLRIFRKLDVVTVFGRRSKTSLRFLWRKERAREVHDQIVDQVRRAQAGLAEQIAATEPPPPAVSTAPNVEPRPEEQFPMPPAEQ